MDIKSVERAVNMLAGTLHMRMDFNSFNTGKQKLLIVEGQTDEKFIKGHLRDDVVCMVANKAFGTGNGFAPKPTINNKRAIIEVVYGLSVLPAIIKCPKGSEKWSVYGMIDMDFDDEGSHSNTSKLFVTDTHDLETLMILTDGGLFQRIKKCAISTDDTQKALFMAYQMGKIRQLISDEISIEPISSGKREVVYSSFFSEDYKVSIGAVISYINQNTEEPLSAAKEKKLVSRLLKDKSIKKCLSQEGFWKDNLESFDIQKTDDFWNVVNGHDILSLLRHINDDARRIFKKSSMYSLNREFEMALIEAYNPSNFKKTKIYSCMVAENVVNA